jgi:hypothetical protein
LDLGEVRDDGRLSGFRGLQIPDPTGLHIYRESAVSYMRDA